MKKIVVFTGAGISAESGLQTFRDANGLWEGHNVYEVATPEGFAKNPELVLEFYNQRRRQLLQVNPNLAHKNLVKLEDNFNVHIITQNIDDLHERAGSSKVLHLHGELLKAKSSVDDNLIFDWKTDIKIGDVCPLNSQLRPHVVWFGEAVTQMENAIKITESADILLVIGTSLQVYPAAGLLNYIKNNAHIYLIDPKPMMESNKKITVIKTNAVEGTEKLLELLYLK